MSFQLLKEQIIDPGFCQGCGLCAGVCKNIEYIDLKPVLTSPCHVEKGDHCGKCFLSCPQVIQKELIQKEPLKILSLQSTDKKILKSAESGGFVTTLNKYLLDNKQIGHLVQVKKLDDRPISMVVKNSENIEEFAGVTYGRTGILHELMKTTNNQYDSIGIVGVPCEIRGSKNLQKQMKDSLDLVKISLFCNASIRTNESDKGIVKAPCILGCPAGVDAAGYIQLIKNGKYQEAVDLIRENNPFPSVCGRVCTNQCEFVCTLHQTSNPVAIRELKRFVTEWEMSVGSRKPLPKVEKTGKKVAIVGSGPSGLTCAYYLSQLGHDLTVFERSNKVGGMLRLGIPQFRLPDEVLDHDIDYIKGMGVEIKTDSPIESDPFLTDWKKKGYDAVFYAIGQYEPWELEIEGKELKGVDKALNFLMEWKYDQKNKENPIKDKIVAVIGGGSVAIDSAQTALRLGAKKVKILYRRSQKELPARVEDYENALREGIEFNFLCNPTRFIGNEEGNLKQIELIKIELGEPDESNRCTPITKKGSEYLIDADYAIVAIGQGVVTSMFEGACIDEDAEFEIEKGKVVVDNVTFETSIPGVFASGDMVRKSLNIAIAAIAHGKQVAESIDRFLKGKDLKEGREPISKLFYNGPSIIPDKHSIRPEPEKIDNFFMNFDDIEGNISKDIALMESNRCLSCNNYCNHCQDYVGQDADISAGEVGSEKGYTTVLVWTERGEKWINDLIQQKLVIEGNVKSDEIDKMIKAKMSRPLIGIKLTPEEQINKLIFDKTHVSISQLNSEIDLPPKEIRYLALTMVKEEKLSMELDEELGEPIFSAFIDED